MTTPGPKRSASAIIFLVVFLDLLGVGIIAPLSPYIVGKFDSSGTAVGLLTLCYSAAQFLATPVLGVLSDRLGRRRILFVSVLGSAAGYVLFATAGSLHWLFVARIIDGFTGGNIATAQAAIADVTPAQDRATAYGLIGAAFGLGFLFGPAFSAALAPWGALVPIWAAAGLSLLTATLIYFILPETLPPERRRRDPVAPRDFNPFGVIARAWTVPGAAMLLLAVLAIGLAHAELRATFGILLRDRFNYNEHRAGIMFAFMGLIAVLVQGGLVRKVAPALGDKRTALVGLPIAIAGYFLIPAAPTPAWIYPAIALCGLGMGLATPPLTSILSRKAPDQARGEVMGASQGVQSLALVVGPLAAGSLYDHAGPAWPFWTAAGSIAAAMLIVTAVRDARARAVDVPASAGGPGPNGEPNLPLAEP